MLLRFFISTIILLSSFSTYLYAQLPINENKIILNAKVINGDTIPYTYLKQVTIYNPDIPGLAGRKYKKYKRQQSRNRRRYSKLRRNVYKTYPYAVMAAYVVNDIDSAMLKIRSKDAQTIYKKRKEKELTDQYKGKLENLTMSQGRTLVILIARETGKDCYSIIKDLKGGFNARIWQTLATLFANNLKRDYDPVDKDLAIEQIVREIEASGKFVRTNN